MVVHESPGSPPTKKGFKRCVVFDRCACKECPPNFSSISTGDGSIGILDLGVLRPRRSNAHAPPFILRYTSIECPNPLSPSSSPTGVITNFPLSLPHSITHLIIQFLVLLCLEGFQLGFGSNPHSLRLQLGLGDLTLTLNLGSLCTGLCLSFCGTCRLNGLGLCLQLQIFFACTLSLR